MIKGNELGMYLYKTYKISFSTSHQGRTQNKEIDLLYFSPLQNNLMFRQKKKPKGDVTPLEVEVLALLASC